MSRVRSPNYPSMSLPAALDRIRAVHKAEARNPASREAIAKHIGFGGINGASATALSALVKYGLLEDAKDGEWRVSELAMRILFPHDDEEKASALQEAAFRPSLFAKLREKWPERAPSEANLHSYLTREGFSPNAVTQVIQFYRETLDIASVAASDNGAASEPTQRGPAMQTAAQKGNAPSTFNAPPALPPGRPYKVGFEGPTLVGTFAINSLKEFDRLMIILNAQKAVIEAMEDDADEPATQTQQSTRDNDHNDFDDLIG